MYAIIQLFISIRILNEIRQIKVAFASKIPSFYLSCHGGARISFVVFNFVVVFGSKVLVDSRFLSKEREESLAFGRVPREPQRVKKEEKEKRGRERESKRPQRERKGDEKFLDAACWTMEGIDTWRWEGEGKERWTVEGGDEEGEERREREREKRHVVQVDAIRAGDRTQCLWLSSLTRESLTNVLFLPCM